LYVHGDAGAGKTCALLCLSDHVPGSEYTTAADLCERLARSQQGREEWYHEGRGGILWPEKLWQSFGRAPLVIVDELGARDRVSDHAYECVKRMIDERHGLPLALTSNHDLESMARLYDDRIASRIAAGTIFHLDDEDRRLGVNDDTRSAAP
jgi:DNA replication protein DnaC